jgi:hypothetical protein
MLGQWLPSPSFHTHCASLSSALWTGVRFSNKCEGHSYAQSGQMRAICQNWYSRTTFSFAYTKICERNVTSGPLSLASNCVWCASSILTFFFFFFAFPFSPNRPIRYLLRSAWFLFPLWCGGALGYFPRLPTPTLSPLLFLDDTTRISQHTTSMGGHPAWDLNPADLAVVSGECRSSFHHPTVSPY